ncbi:MAG: hypothetical protein R3C05_29970 [Pirellulaceae bacterium]
MHHPFDHNHQRIVVTGVSVISPLGIGIDSLHDMLHRSLSHASRSEPREPVGPLSVFSGSIEDFGDVPSDAPRAAEIFEADES